MFPVCPRAATLAAALLPMVAMAAPLTLEQAVDQALQRSEARRSGRAAVASASEAARAAGQLPDPMLGLSLENLPITGPDRLSTAREDMTMKRIALSQEWVPQAKRVLQSAAAQATVAREAVAAATAAADTRLQAALAFLDAYYAAEALAVSEHNEAHAREAAETARARLAAGAGSAPDVLALASAQGIAADESAQFRQQLAAARLNLARWTGAPADELAKPVVPAFAAEQDYVDAHPMVLARQRELEVARREASLTAANRRPNWTWELAYGQRSGNSDLLSIGVTIPLPVAAAARQDRETASKLALAEKAEAELVEATRAAQAEYRMLASDARRLQERIATYERSVLATAGQRMAAATAAYRANQGSLSMVFEARHMELEAQRKLLDLQRELAKVQAQLAFKPLRAEELQ